jgi:mannonate dehydratase
MKETWRWFGPQDPVSLSQVKQAGATGVVTALHHIYRGEAWSSDEVLKRKHEIESAGLVWCVVESIPVHNSIKLRSGPYRQYIDAWKDSLAAIAQAGVQVVSYNFMPVVDWTRTNLRWRLPSTGYALRFDAIDLAAYDLFILLRKNALTRYQPDQIAAARARFDAMPESRGADLEQTIIAGLPGAEASYDREAFRRRLSEYEGFTPVDLRANLLAFLREIVPVAE